MFITLSLVNLVQYANKLNYMSSNIQFLFTLNCCNLLLTSKFLVCTTLTVSFHLVLNVRQSLMRCTIFIILVMRDTIQKKFINIIFLVENQHAKMCGRYCPGQSPYHWQIALINPLSLVEATLNSPRILVSIN